MNNENVTLLNRIISVLKTEKKPMSKSQIQTAVNKPKMISIDQALRFLRQVNVVVSTKENQGWTHYTLSEMYSTAAPMPIYSRKNIIGTLNVTPGFTNHDDKFFRRDDLIKFLKHRKFHKKPYEEVIKKL